MIPHPIRLVNLSNFCASMVFDSPAAASVSDEIEGHLFGSCLPLYYRSVPGSCPTVS